MLGVIREGVKRLKKTDEWRTRGEEEENKSEAIFEEVLLRSFMKFIRNIKLQVLRSIISFDTQIPFVFQ